MALARSRRVGTGAGSVLRRLKGRVFSGFGRAGATIIVSGSGNMPPIKLGNSGEFSIRELAELVVELSGSKSKLVYRPLPQDDPKQRKPGISRAKKELDRMPAIKMRAGLQRSIPVFRACSENGGALRLNHHELSKDSDAILRKIVCKTLYLLCAFFRSFQLFAIGLDLLTTTCHK